MTEMKDPWWHCKSCGFLFQTKPEKARVSCPDCNRGPIIKASDKHASLAEECGASRVSVHVSGKGVIK